MHFAGREAETGPGDAANPKPPMELLCCKPIPPFWEFKTEGGVGERGQQDAVSRSTGAVSLLELHGLSVGQHGLS